MRALAIAVTTLTLAASSQAWSQDVGYRLYSKTAKYEDVRDDLKDAIVKRGLVIDYVGQFNTMLERTADAAGRSPETGRKSPYINAEFMQFCPSKLTHEAVSANPLAVANCPIAVFVYEMNKEPGKIHVGFRTPVASPSRLSKKINGQFVELLDGIAKDATKK